jgi:hypothetical protein
MVITVKKRKITNRDTNGKERNAMSKSTNSIHVIGAGGVGFWLAVGLSRMSLGPVKVYDTDNLTGGLGHTRLPLATPTTTKLQLLRGFLATQMGGNIPELVDAKFTGEEVVPGDLMVDCTDMSGVDRRKVWKAAKKRGARCLRVSYDGQASIVVVAEGLPLTGDETDAGYEAVPTLALSLAAGGIAAEVVKRMLAQPTGYVEFQITLADHVQPVERVA